MPSQMGLFYFTDIQLIIHHLNAFEVIHTKKNLKNKSCKTIVIVVLLWGEKTMLFSRKINRLHYGKREYLVAQ
jgi:hypothetical protein